MKKFKKIISAALCAAILATMAFSINLVSSAEVTAEDLTETTVSKTLALTDPSQMTFIRQTSDKSTLPNGYSENAADIMSINTENKQLVVTHGATYGSQSCTGLYELDTANTTALSGKTITGYSYKQTGKYGAIRAIIFKGDNGSFFAGHLYRHQGSYIGAYIPSVTENVKTVAWKGSQSFSYSTVLAIDENVSYNWLITVEFTDTATAKVTYTALSTAPTDGSTSTDVNLSLSRTYNLANCQAADSTVTSVTPAIGFAITTNPGSVTYTDINVNASYTEDYTDEILGFVNANAIVEDIKADTAFSAENYKERISEAQAAVLAFAQLSEDAQNLAVSNGYYDAEKLQSIINLEAALAESTKYLADNTIVGQTTTVSADNAVTVYKAAKKAIAEYASLSDEAKALTTAYNELELLSLQKKAEVYITGTFEEDFSDIDYSNLIWKNTKAADLISGATAETVNFGYSYSETSDETSYTRTEAVRNNKAQMIISQNSLKFTNYATYGSSGGTANTQYLGTQRIYSDRYVIEGETPESAIFNLKMTDISKGSAFYVVIGGKNFSIRLVPDTTVTQGDVTASVSLNTTAKNYSATQTVKIGTVADGVYTPTALTLTYDFNKKATVEETDYHVVSITVTDVNGTQATAATYSYNSDQYKTYGIDAASLQAGFKFAARNLDGNENTVGFDVSKITVKLYEGEALPEDKEEEEVIFTEPKVAGSSMLVDGTIADQNLRFQYSFDNTATAPEGYSVVSYGAILMTNASLNSSADLLTADYTGKNDVSPVIVEQEVAAASEIPEKWYIEINGTALSVSGEKAGSRVASRAFVIYKNDTTNEKTYVYSTNDNIGTDGETVVVENGQINRSLIGCAKNIIKALITKNTDYADDIIFDSVTAAEYVASTGSTTTAQKEAIVKFVTDNADAIKAVIS